MALMDGKAFADERLVDAAGHVLHAYYKAPLVTGKVEHKAVVITGEHLDPVIEFVDRMDKKLDGAAKDLFFPLYVDHMCLKVARDEGYSPVVVALGADYTKADLGWDCGACGFSTSRDYLKYSGENKGMGALCAGPSCAWKALDHGIAVDYACAAAHELNVENRILSTIGLVTMLLGYLDGVSATWALALGPQVETWWYSRPSLAKWLDPQMLQGMLHKNYANHFQMFSTKLRPRVKKDGPWWEEKPEYVLGIGPDEEYGTYQQQVLGALMESVGELRPKVQALRGLAETTSGG
ncbi:MAG: hypothetical protein HZB55_08755 [Deltaproteobacteria bacterium]|nr:hypothetical protein [Deltaproteobacteria bacterium]